MASQTASNSVEQRADPRYSAHLKATLSVDRRRFPVMIRDISLLECCLYGAIDVRKGDEVILFLKGINVVATIAWTKGRYAGANFHREIDPGAIISLGADHAMFARRLSNTMMVHV